MKTFVLMMVSLLFAISSEAQNKSFYDFTVKTIDGKDFPLSLSLIHISEPTRH